MVIFLQRTFTSLVHAHAGRTQEAARGYLTRGVNPHSAQNLRRVSITGELDVRLANQRSANVSIL